MEWDEEKSALFFLLKWMIANELHNLTSPLFLKRHIQCVCVCVCVCLFVCVCMHVHLTENFGINILNHVDWDYFCWEQQKLILANLRERKRSSPIGLTLEYILQSKEWVIKLWKGKELGSFKA